MTSEYLHAPTTPENTINVQFPRGRASDSDFPMPNIAASRSTQQLHLELNKLSFLVRESKLIMIAAISVIAIASAVTIIIAINECSVNSACFSVISMVVGGWISLLTRNGSKSKS